MQSMPVPQEQLFTVPDGHVLEQVGPGVFALRPAAPVQAQAGAGPWSMQQQLQYSMQQVVQQQQPLQLGQDQQQWWQAPYLQQQPLQPFQQQLSAVSQGYQHMAQPPQHMMQQSHQQQQLLHHATHEAAAPAKKRAPSVLFRCDTQPPSACISIVQGRRDAHMHALHASSQRSLPLYNWHRCRLLTPVASLNPMNPYPPGSARRSSSVIWSARCAHSYCKEAGGGAALVLLQDMAVLCSPQ